MFFILKTNICRCLPYTCDLITETVAVWLVVLYLLLFSVLAPLVAFNKNGLVIEFRCERDNNSPTVSVINVKASNASPSQMSEFLFQAAVPKVFLCYSIVCVYHL